MADAALRALERAAVTDPSAEAPLLRMRIQVGLRWAGACSNAECEYGRVDRDTDEFPISFDETWRKDCPDCAGTGHPLYEEGVELAAYLGDPAAREALDENWKWLPYGIFPSTFDLVCPGAADVDALSMARWLSGLHWPGALLRGTIAAGEMAYVTYAQQERDEHVRIFHEEPERYATRAWKRYAAQKLLAPRDTLASARAHADNPSKETRERWMKDYEDVPPDAGFVPGSPDAVDAHWRGCFSVAVRFTSEDTVRTAIRDALVPWALEVA